MNSITLKALFGVFLICIFFPVTSQIIYHGSIGDNAIEMIIRISADNEITGAYSLDTHKAPLRIKGQLPGGSLKNLKNMFVVNDKGEIEAIFEIIKHQDDDIFSGNWTNMNSKKEIHFTLQKEMVVSGGGNFGGIELFQCETLPDKYFKLVLKTDSLNYSTYIEKVKVIEKKTDKVVQEIADLTCTLMYFDNISVFDYNFDGNMDFSIFESYHGSLKTQRLYFLYNSKTKKYDQANITDKTVPPSEQKAKTVISKNTVSKF